MNKIKEAILKTLVYADVFDYPLTTSEVWRWLIKCNNATMQQCNNAIEKLPEIDQKDGFNFLKNRKEIVALRKKRERWSREKLKMAKRAASWLKFIPWIKMVGITGALAMENTDRDDDIDILIVSTKNKIWLTRFLATILMEFLGKRRHPGACHPERSEGSLANASLDKPRDSSLTLRMTTARDKICLNMYLDADHLQVPKKEQDLFTAHEVVQVKLLWDKNQTYQKFLAENLWVKKYLPNAPFQRPLPCPRENRGVSARGGLMKIVAESIFDFFENLSKRFQLWYMQSRRTTEIISDGIIRFHPQDARKWVLTRYQKSLKIALIRKE